MNNIYICKFCNNTFALKRTLAYHIKTSKRCVEQRPKVDINCIWCKGKFNTKEELDKHHKKCEADKDIIYIKLLEECKTKDLLLKEKEKEKEKEIERLNDIIKDLTDKFNIGSINTTNNTINTTTTYNITLNCSKPLILSTESITPIMNRTCEPSYIKRGQSGLADWFLNNICRNEKGDITIECTDKNRKRFRYIDEEDKPNEVTGKGLKELLNRCMLKFKESEYYHQAKKQAKQEYDEFQTTSLHNAIKDFESPDKEFINYLVDKTHIDSINCLIDKKQ